MSTLAQITWDTPPRATPSVLIWQNVYADGLEPVLDPAFTPLDGRRNPRTEYRELALFARAYHSGRHLAADYTGIVSPKFGEKTGISGTDFLRFIADHPGADAYFINPFPQNAYFSFNVWDHAEQCHPGLTRLTQTLLTAANIPITLASLGRNSHDTLLYSNYWVGNARFWDRFMDLNLRLLAAFEHLSPTERAPYLAHDPDYPDPVPLLPFLFERLFSTLLLTDPTLIARPWPHSRPAILRAAAPSPEEYRLVLAFADLIDTIDRTNPNTPQSRAVFTALSTLKKAQKIKPRLPPRK